MSYKSVLFDLDGTLLDTAPDFAHVLDGMRANRGQPPMDFRSFRTRVSHGATAMLAEAFPDTTEADLEPLRDEFLQRYSRNLYHQTRLFDGMEAVLDAIEARGMSWGIVTNKPAWLTEPLLELAGLASRARCVVSGDTLSVRKPDPAPVLHACALAGCAASEAVYIGDAERDIQAGRAGGLRTAVALFGYIHPDDHPQDWGADALLQTPAGVLEFVA